ncbi:MAG: hypothetical protein U0L49_06885 [Eubacterium sp.]|nr:hypothetical protein [Eubacterium sp.]
MIELFEGNLHDQGRKSSKGNQLKWRTEGGIWYKADGNGYEGLAEYTVSKLLGMSSLSTEEFVIYETDQIAYRKKQYNGCRSRDFLKPGEQLITLERLFQKRYHASLYLSIFQIEGAANRLKFLVNQTEQMTGLSGFGIYMEKMLTIDAFFLNEDRHTHNIAVISMPDGNYRFCPFFDQGASLLSDTEMDYPMDGDIYELIDSVRSKTIAFGFDDQLDAADELYGCHLNFKFGKSDVKNILEQEPYYPEPVKRRVQNVILDRMRKYSYLFES